MVMGWMPQYRRHSLSPGWPSGVHYAHRYIYPQRFTFMVVGGLISIRLQTPSEPGPHLIFTFTTNNHNKPGPIKKKKQQKNYQYAFYRHSNSPGGKMAGGISKKFPTGENCVYVGFRRNVRIVHSKVQLECLLHSQSRSVKGYLKIFYTLEGAFAFLSSLTTTLE